MRSALSVAVLVVVLAFVGCSCGETHTSDDAGAELDVAQLPDAPAVDVGLPDAADEGVLDAADAPGTDAGCGAVDASQIACDGRMVLRGRPVPFPYFDPLGPIDGVFVFASAQDGSPPVNAMARIPLDIASQDRSLPLEGYPYGAPGVPTSAGWPEAATSGVDAVAVSIDDGAQTLLAIYDAHGALRAPLIPLGAGVVIGSLDVGCEEVRAMTYRVEPTCGVTLRGLVVGLDGIVRRDTGARAFATSSAVYAVWRGDRWAAALVPCDAAASFEVVQLTPEGTSTTPVPVGIAVGQPGAFVGDVDGDWGVLFRGPGGALSHARFDPSSGAVRLAPHSVYGTVSGAPRVRGVREAGDVDGFAFVETLSATDTRTVLIRVRGDGTVMQAEDIERTAFPHDMPYFRWVGDRYSLTMLGGTDVLSCGI